MGTSYDQKGLTAIGNYATAQTNVVLVAAPAAGYKISVKQVLFTSSTAQTLTLKSSTTTTKLISYTAANGGINPTESDGQELFSCDSGEALTVTTTGLTSFILVVYTVALA